jgi:hypothetical protein
MVYRDHISQVTCFFIKVLDKKVQYFAFWRQFQNLKEDGILSQFVAKQQITGADELNKQM